MLRPAKRKKGAGEMKEQTESSREWFPTYLSVKEAACILGVSERSVYGYIAQGKLYGRRIDDLIRIEAKDVYAFKGTAPGRMRVSPPRWRVPPLKNLSYLTTITVRVQQGQGNYWCADSTSFAPRKSIACLARRHAPSCGASTIPTRSRSCSPGAARSCHL